MFVSTLWLVGSKTDGRFVVVEKTPAATQIREPEGDTIVCANHFKTTGLADGTRNKTYIQEGTSVSRETRMGELLHDGHGAINPVRAAEFLRDRDLPGGAFPGNGHRATLNALIATHAMIMDLTDGIFWAASPPNQLGKFVAFDVQDFAHELPDKMVPADPALASGEFDAALMARNCLTMAQRALKDHRPHNALDLSDRAETLNPGFYQNAVARGRRCWRWTGRGAGQAFQKALAEHPAFLKERKELEALCARRGRRTNILHTEL